MKLGERARRSVTCRLLVGVISLSMVNLPIPQLLASQKSSQKNSTLYAQSYRVVQPTAQPTVQPQVQVPVAPAATAPAVQPREIGRAHV